jgi:N-acetylneuraminic acid mutarotase
MLANKADNSRIAFIARAGMVFMVVFLVLWTSPAFALTSQFFSNDTEAADVIAGASHEMNDPAWLVNGKQNRGSWAYKVYAALFMLGYQTETFQSGHEQVNVLKAFQAGNTLPQTSLLNAAALTLLDQQLAVREQVLASIASGFPVTVYSHIQSPAPNDVSQDTIAALQALNQSELPANLQMSATEMVQCIAGQCNGFIKAADGVTDIWTPVDMNSDYRFVLSYFDPLVANTKMPGAAVTVETNLHEYAHYLDGFYYGLGGYYSGNFKTAQQPHFGALDTRGFYDISYDITTGYHGCFTQRSTDPKDWISKYGFANYGSNSCSAGKGWPFEEWAEAFQMYVTSGRVFRSAAAQSAMIASKYDWLKNNVFGGREYDTDLGQAANSGCNDVTGYGGYMHCISSTPWDFTLPHGAVNGSCGGSDGGTFIALPKAGLCSAGRASDVDSSGGKWNWNCSGLNGGSGSAPCSASILTGTTPDAPSGVTAIAGNTQAIVTFTPGSAGSSPTTGYTATSFPAGGVDSNAGSTSLNHIVTGLTNGVAYTFTVKGHNDFGDGPSSDLSNSVTPTWGLVSENFDTAAPPGLPVGWQTLVQLQSEGFWATNAGSHFPLDIAANSPNNLVYFNAHSSGVNRSARLVTPPFSLAGVTGAKVSFWMYRDGDGSAGVWNANDKLDVYIGSPLSTPHMNGSEVQIGTTINRSKWLAPIVSSPGWYHYVFDIPPAFSGSNNYIMFLGYGAGGNDIFLDDITVAIPPGAPSFSSVTGGKGQATVTIVPPLNNGGSDITGYTVVSNPPGGSDAQAGTTALTRTITGLTNGTTYTFTVTATTAVGSGLSSSASGSVTPADVPGAPVIGSVTPGNGTVQVNFTVPANDGGATIDSYTVTSSPDGIMASWTSSPIMVPGLTNGTDYTFTVTASNRAGTGAPSNSSQIVTTLLSYDFPTINGTPSATVVRGASYSFIPTATKTTRFSISGNLPPGLGFNTGTGATTGKPDTLGTYSNIIITAHNQVTDQNNTGQAALPPFTITVMPPLPDINAYLDLNGTVGADYGIWIYTTDVTALSDLNGTLPPGLQLLPSDVPWTWSLEGIPTTPGVYSNIVIRASNISGFKDLGPFTITVKLPAPTIGGSPSTIGMVGIPYSGYTPSPCSYSPLYISTCNATLFSINTLPSGMNFDTATGILSGTPTVAGTYSNLIITASNADWTGGQAAALPTFTLTISPRIESFTAGSSLKTARQDHTATLLPNGKILVAGGSSADYATLASAELYDPTTDSWGLAGSMAVPRTNHTATLLQDGKVLITGGLDDSGTPLASAELYDSGDNSWLPADVGPQNMGTTRIFHLATLLADGRVMVTGGFDADYMNLLTSTEVYNPADRTWSAVHSMIDTRYEYTATLLGNDKVLVAGGTSDGNSAEFYQPAGDIWSPTGAMIRSRNQHTATALSNGNVLIAGGTELASNMDSSSVELYDPQTNSWSVTGSMITARQSHSASLLPDTTVLVAGGIVNNTLMPFAELYNPADSSWKVAGYLATPRTNFTTTVLANGNVLVIGGRDKDSTILANIEIYHYAYTVRATAGLGGSITPLQQTVLSSADSTPIVVVPAQGYHIASIHIDGVSQAISNPDTFTYTFMSVAADHTIDAAFAPDTYALNVTLAGSGGGGGTVSDHAPGGYYCNGNPCLSALYAAGNTVTLYATPDSDSLFSGWSLNCGITGNCVLTMAAPKSVIATFDRLQWAKNENKTPPFYGLLINAYKDASNGDTIKAQSYIFGEELKFDNSINVIFDGGYDASYQNITPGYATVQGTMKISKGKVSVRRVKVK